MGAKLAKISIFFSQKMPIAMTTDKTVIDFQAERQQRLHDLHEKRLQAVRAAFEKALPLPKSKNKAKKRKKQ